MTSSSLESKFRNRTSEDKRERRQHLVTVQKLGLNVFRKRENSLFVLLIFTEDFLGVEERNVLDKILVLYAT